MNSTAFASCSWIEGIRLRHCARILSLIAFCLTVSGRAMAQDTTRGGAGAPKPVALTFSPLDAGFTGAGWDFIKQKVKGADHVLVGEDHFIHEIPAFVEAIADQRTFTDFLCEMDPISAVVLEEQLLTRGELLKTMPATFSFYGQREERSLVAALVKKQVHLHGADQVVMNADRLLASSGLEYIRDARVRGTLERMRDSSAACFERFLKDPTQAMYMMTPGFEEDLSALDAASDREVRIKELATVLRESRAIYMEQNHQRRVDLLRANFRASRVADPGHHALLKFGAIHGPRGESLFGMPDIGDALARKADSTGTKSLHIMIVGMSGGTGSPFPGFPGATLDASTGPLAALAPFFAAVEGDAWHAFDLVPLRSCVRSSAKETEGEAMLRRVIEGYDLLVVIPKVTPGSF